MAGNGNTPRDESWLIDAFTGELIEYRETYGIYSLEVSPMEEDHVPDAPLYVRESDRLVVRARAELRAAGEQTDQEITERFDLVPTLGGLRNDRPTHDALVNWFEGIILRHGKLS